MQTLYVKFNNSDGKPSQKAVKVIRSWAQSGGQQLYLHADGTHGYKDGAPVISEQELRNLIHDKHQLEQALTWWRLKGAAQSTAYYEKRSRDLESRQISAPLPEGDNSNLDATQYVRRLVSDRRREAYSGVTTWIDWFPVRPDWWGFATVIEIGGYRYVRSDEYLKDRMNTEQGPSDDGAKG